MPGSDRNRFRALEYLAKIQARGGTEMALPLCQAVARLKIAQRVESKGPVRNDDRERDKILVLVTDGQVGNEDQILQSLEAQLDGIRVFSLGIDQAVNESFLRRLAGLGRGACELVESEDRLDEVMDSIHRQIGTPILTGFALYPDGFAIETDSIVPERLPDLFPGSPLLILGRYRGHPVGRLVVEAKDRAGSLRSEVVQGQVRDNPAIASVWARNQVRKLEDRYTLGKANLDEIERQLVSLSLQFSVLSRFTAYVAIDHSQTANKKGELHRITQPVETPEGWHTHASFCLAAPADMAYMSPEQASGASLGDMLINAMSNAFVRELGAAGSHPASTSPPTPTRKSAVSRDSRGADSASLNRKFGLPDQYRSVRQLGLGGMGAVYEAFDRIRGQAVMIKIHPVHGDHSEEFRKAVATLLPLRHPGLVPVLEVRSSRDTVIVVHDAVKSGRPLVELLSSGPRTLEVSARWVAQIADAVQYLFEHGLIYRDITPSALTIDGDGNPRLVDLYSACIAEGVSWPGALVGVPAYMAPELVRGESEGRDVRSSVYSLGLVLYELLTGVRPYSGSSSLDTLQRVLKEVLKTPRSIRRSIPKELEAICLKAMARKAEDRYATPGELAEALRNYLGGQPVKRKRFWKRT
jgi:hypothetical protein